MTSQCGRAIDHSGQTARGKCLVCDRAQRKAWRLSNPDKVKARDKRAYRKYSDKVIARTRAWYKANPDKVRERSWRRRGIRLTHGDYLLMYAAQGGCCAICGTRHNRLRVDHDHVTQKIRGLLCNRCNVGLGMMSDSPTTCRLAADYLDRYQG